MRKTIRVVVLFFPLAGLTLLGCLLSRCKKEKVPNTIPLPPGENSPSSGIRLFNLTGDSIDITVNNIPLTSYKAINQNASSTALGLLYFPKGRWADASSTGGAFAIPTTLLDTKGKAHIVLTGNLIPSGNSPTAATQLNIDTTISNDPLRPYDYYLTFRGHFIKIARNITAPSSQSNFKLRVLNLGETNDAFSLNGPVCVTYANGHPVPGLSGVPVSGTSASIELPFGAYAFKVFVGADSSSVDYTKQLTQVPTFPNFDYVNVKEIPLQYYFYPPVSTFKAGASYTILATRNFYSFNIPGQIAPYNTSANSYRIIQENSPSVNPFYAVLQGVNATSQPSIKFQLDGQLLVRNGVAPESYTSSVPIVVGPHTIQAIDAATGTVLTTSQYIFNPNDDVTAWLYKNNGQYALLFADNDVTSSYYIGRGITTIPVNTENGSNVLNTYGSNAVWQARFLNFSEDIPYTTFTNNYLIFGTGTYNVGIDSETVNVPQATALQKNPYLFFLVKPSLNNPPVPPNVGFSTIRVFQSEPGTPAIIPGSLALGVPGLAAGAFVADSSRLYKQANIIPPAGEPGIYTVALVGSALNSTAHMFIVKHNL